MNQKRVYYVLIRNGAAEIIRTKKRVNKRNSPEWDHVMGPFLTKHIAKHFYSQVSSLPRIEPKPKVYKNRRKRYRHACETCTGQYVKGEVYHRKECPLYWKNHTHKCPMCGELYKAGHYHQAACLNCEMEMKNRVTH